ncbi:MAG: CvpA family protein [gamma proteobacterium symbiont of Bathyaustriella thionipta]|nr:CvpA family protein [gamma proteobacterium symbiont of Bathyaustriella thionipta]MCU7950066.1 CvpA family protein [gamma proteobacterium symbiont of Bathyaustriella thionipta]MCU7952551.1 CvpA family protein [gamma proteobacterium symbiont of Bathyaustriella thionipta]MCU7957036.1 CvpA family protein [gamma proteobacterium symbiont of Bathyaustriella thionipta]MCU7967410.1 CvpA family protein [gamma proteobacterium symbiont of Bathyaustriella thionipta]
MSLIWPDYIIIAIIAVSTVISLFRGFVRESLALAGWILAVWISLMFMDQMSVFINPYLNLPPSILSLVSFALLFILTLIVSALVTNLAAKLVDSTGLSGTDRSIGMLFGIARGIIIVGILVLLAGFTLVPQDPWWKESALITHFQQLAVVMKDFLPPHIAAKLHY